MIVYSNRGWVYIKKEKTLLKKRNKAIDISSEKGFNIKLRKISLKYIKSLKDCKLSIYDLTITNLSHEYDVVSWAMHTHNKEIEVYQNKFEIAFCDIAFLIKYPIWFKVKDIIIKKDKNKIEIEYQIKNSFLVYLIVDEWVDFYVYLGEIRVRFSEKDIDWLLYKTMYMEELLDTIINNKKCVIELLKEEIYYEMSIKYKGKDVTSGF